ncbi:FAD:protein FMN transferase [Micromonospora sp. WMMD812]|uniref:FAD:protein FMN transferase n=1 Tax=Micromonospora sp. WMMD812 TaxID=3015152 RepID=UPI00248D0837|nr:FAD:protein FMN transferase [Micromonospora sp. WMMD812]WBB67730.1 FAD:protein FMN transferase [Micromonospora sp. WMMD812]
MRLPAGSRIHRHSTMDGGIPGVTTMTAKATYRFAAIGATWEIVTERPLGAALRDEIQSRIAHFDHTYSRFRPDSLVSRIAEAPRGGRFTFPDDAVALFDLYDRLAVATGGAMDPLIGRRLESLGYDPVYSLRPVPQSETALRRPSWTRDVVRDGTTIVTGGPLTIDVGAAGKGLLVDLVTGLLSGAGISSCVVDASGDLRHHGPEGIRVGLEHPDDPRLVIGTIRLHGQALCASAINRRAWGAGLHHILDARTGEPVRDVVATWAIADDTMTADALATALFFTPPSRLTPTFRFCFVRVFADGRAERCGDLDGELFTPDSVKES